MKRGLFLLLILLFTANFSFTQTKTEAVMSDEIPKNIIIVSQSCTMNNLYISAIDMSNNEFIIIFITNIIPAKAIVKVLRTGSFIDPNLQHFTKGADAPFKPKDNK